MSKWHRCRFSCDSKISCQSPYNCKQILLPTEDTYLCIRKSFAHFASKVYQYSHIALVCTLAFVLVYVLYIVYCIPEVLESIISFLKGKYHEMVCQLRPFVYSLGLNNPPYICLTPRKSRVKNLWHNKQGNCQCKMAGTGIRSFAKLGSQMPRIATTGITPWKTALKWTADCQAPCSGCQENMQSGHSCGNLLSNWFILCVAIRATVILFMAICSINAADCHNPRYTFEHGAYQETEFQLPPFYIKSPPVWSVLSSCRTTCRV
jgi:hypothetical protein